LIIFGCIVFVQNTKVNLKKLEDRGTRMIFVGYECMSKAYRAYDPVTKRVTITRNVIFDEAVQWDWSGDGAGDGGGDQGAGEFVVQYRVDPDDAVAYGEP
jgi:hypothetical protein